MLYLEDYLEMIEHLPQELIDRFTEMRELDLTVQNSMDSLEKKSRNFFQQCKRGELQNEGVDTEFQTLRKEYYKVLEDADEKVTIATQIHELVERYLRRLDSELFKFKCELEADNNGITEILEKRSLEMDAGSNAALMNVISMNQKENRYYGSLPSVAAALPTSSSSSNSHGIMGASASSVGSGSVNASIAGVNISSSVSAVATAVPKENRYRIPKTEKRRDSSNSSLTSVLPEKRPNLGGSTLATTSSTTAAAAGAVTVVRPITPGLSAHVLNPAAAASVGAPATAPPGAYNAIAAAASQAILDCQQMPQGRRTASLKASYEAIHGAGGGPTEFWIPRDISTGTAQTNLNAEKKQKKKGTSSLSSHNLSSSASINTPSSNISLASSSSSLSADSDILPSASLSSTNVGATLSSLGLSASTSAAARSAVNSSISSTSSIVQSTAAAASAASSILPTANMTINDNGMVVEQTPEGEWSYDPNEPRYCTCNQVSYGDMVACDNDACPYEWFHYPCVGITQPPKGKWYCPKCTAMRRRGNRKN